MATTSRSFLTIAALAMALCFALNPTASHAATKKASGPMILDVEFAWNGDSIDDITPTTADHARLTLNPNYFGPFYDPVWGDKGVWVGWFVQ